MYSLAVLTSGSFGLRSAALTAKPQSLVRSDMIAVAPAVVPRSTSWPWSLYVSLTVLRRR